MFKPSTTEVKNPENNGRTPLQAPLKYILLFSYETEKENKEVIAIEQACRIKYLKKYKEKTLRKMSILQSMTLKQ